MKPRTWFTTLALIVAASLATAQDLPLFRWENFTTANGLPDNHVFCVLVDGKRIWSGTENGLGLYENGAWRVFRPSADPEQPGIAHQAVLSLALDHRTGDVWAGTMGGLSRISAGRIDNFTQLNSGLSNDIVYGVGVHGDLVWTATAAGASRLNTRTGQWALFNERNTPMYEIWTYAVSATEDKVYYAVWGGGVLEYDVKTERWKDYNDPDGETELVLMKDQGLIHEITTSVSYVDKILWVATMGGLSRFSGGRFDTYTQLSSGLPNDVVYGVAVQDESVWVATAAGGSRLNTRTGEWSLFNERNTPMYEIWTYAVNTSPSKVYYAVWGGGVLEYDVKTERWKDYNDPDGETEIVLYKDQGLIHEITTSVSYVEKDKILWVATYFGASRYDGRNWKNFLEKDSGLPSNFLNQVKAVDGNHAWFSTDKGLAYYDGENWAVYRPALDTHKPEMLIRDAAGKVTRRETQTAPAHHYVLGVDFDGEDIWVATAKGLSHGIRMK
jgi:ligand-binding sensor domain-containing protein